MTSKLTFNNVLWGLFLLLPLLLIIPETRFYRMTKGFEEAEEVLVEVHDPHDVSPYNIGSLIHLHSSDIKPSSVLFDPQFGFEDLTRSIKISRTFEFCQWEEIIHEDEDDEGNVSRTYTYVKGWTSFPIPSVFFNQPFAHHNPLRNPYSDAVFQVRNVTLGSYTVNETIVKEKNSDWKIKNFNSTELRNFNESEASLLHKFVYIGDGVFYSPYQEETQWKLFRLAGRLLEGSTYLFEIGDLMSSCTPGDIRMTTRHIGDESMSVIGKQVDEKGTIDVYITEIQKYPVGILHTGVKTAEEMFGRELKDMRFNLNICRCLVFVWSIIAFFWTFQSHQTVDNVILSGCFGVLFISTIWLFLWGFSRLTIVTLLLSGAFFFFYLHKIHPSLFTGDSSPSTKKVD